MAGKAIVKKAPSRARQIIVAGAQKARKGLSKAAKEREGLKNIAISAGIGYAVGYAKNEGMLDKLPFAKTLDPETSLALTATGLYFFTGNKYALAAAEASAAIAAYKKSRNMASAGRVNPNVSGELGAEEEVGAVEVLD